MQKDQQSQQNQSKLEEIIQSTIQKKCQIQQQNEEYEQILIDPQDISQFVTYIKTKEKKPKTQKKMEKLQKLRADFKNPQLRKQRNRQRHQKQKQKLSKQLQGKNQEQIKQFLKKKKQERIQLKQKLKNSLQTGNGISFLVDMCYQNKMNQKQNKSLATQIQLILRAGKKFQNPPNLHLCGVKGKAKLQLQKMNYQFWKLKSNEQELPQCMKKKEFQNKKFYYLSPDAPQPVQEVNQNCAFIIGGLVDRTVIKNASFNRANELGLQARSLPIRQFMKQRTCLNLDHIVAIICKYQQVKNWEQAFQYGAPTRWKKNSQKNKQKQQKKEEQTETKHEKNNQKTELTQKQENYKQLQELDQGQLEQNDN